MQALSWRLVAVITAVVLVVGVLAGALALVANSGNPGSSGGSANPGARHARSAPRNEVAAPVAPTRVHRVAPVDAAGRLAPGYRLAGSGRGRCFSTSLVDDRLYRCFRGNAILDPCWAQPGGHAVTCLVRPWSRRAVRVRLTAPLPPRQSFGPHLWGLEVGGPAAGRCLMVMGAAGTAAGERISYLCDHGWALLGDRPDRTTPAWTMATARLVHGHFVARGRLPLVAAWLARVR